MGPCIRALHSKIALSPLPFGFRVLSFLGFRVGSGS